MISPQSRKLGFYRKSRRSNKRLIKLFEANQKSRYKATSEDWQDKDFFNKLKQDEKKARGKILDMLKRGKIQTGDDFYRSAWFFHHGNTSRDYALAVALASASHHLGEPWGKNFYAMALDRFLLSIKQPQHFGAQFEKRRGKWVISPYDKKTTDKEREEFSVEPLEKLLKEIKKLNLQERSKRR